MRIAVTGSTGMIGSEVIRLALDMGDEVIAIMRPDSSRMCNLPKGVKIYEADMSDYASLNGIFECDVFFHLAWMKTSGAERDNTHLQADNIQYSLDAVDLAHSCGASVFIGAGSQAEYGICDRALNSSVPVDPVSGYGIAKYAAGKLCRMACSQYGIRFSWARILSVFGETDSPNTLISYLIDSLLEGSVPELTPCEQDWDYIYSKDAARALYDISRFGNDGQVYCIGSGSPRLLKDYVLSVCKAVGGGADVKFGAKPYYPHQPMHLCADISELTADTGFVPKYTFEEGIDAVVRYKRASRNLHPL